MRPRRLAVRTETDGYDNRLDEATTHVITVAAAGITTTTLDVDTRTRNSETRYHCVMQFDFQLGFGDPSTSGSSATSDSGGMQYTQTREHLHEHTNDSTYNHSTRTSYAYTDDTNQSIESFTSFGLSSASVVDPNSGQASESFDMDLFSHHVTFQQRHIEGDGTHESVSGHQGGNWSHALNFTVNVPNWGVLSLSTEQSGFDDLTYAIGHLPTRNYWGTRVTSGQDYNVWHRTSGTDSTTALSFLGSTTTTASHTRTEDWLLPDGTFSSNVHQWGDNNGTSYDAESDNPFTLDDNMPLWLADSFPIQSPGQGPSFAFQQLDNLYWQTGYHGGNVVTQWNNGVAPTLTGQQLLNQVNMIAPTSTGWINNQTINEVFYPRVWSELKVLPSGHYVRFYYTAPPSENGEYIGYVTDIPESQGLGRALAAQQRAYEATKPKPPNEQDEDKPKDAEEKINGLPGESGEDRPRTPPEKAAQAEHAKMAAFDAAKRAWEAWQREKDKPGYAANPAYWEAKAAYVNALQAWNDRKEEHADAKRQAEDWLERQRTYMASRESFSKARSNYQSLMIERDTLRNRLDNDDISDPEERAAAVQRLKNLDRFLPYIEAKVKAQAETHNRIVVQTAEFELRHGVMGQMRLPVIDPHTLQEVSITVDPPVNGQRNLLAELSTKLQARYDQLQQMERMARLQQTGENFAVAYGAIQATGALVEGVTGALLTMAPTGLTQVVGIAMMTHAGDQLRTGILTSATREFQNSLLYGGIYAPGIGLGLSPDIASGVAGTVEVVTDISLGIIAARVKLPSSTPRGYKLLDSPPSFSRIAPNNVFRGDANLSSQLNSKGIPKSLLNEAGDLVPANPTGAYKGRQVSVGEHILGGYRRGAKSNSPFTSFTPDGKVAGGYGGQTVTIDLNALQRAISSGEVKGVQILDQAAVQQAIRNDPLLSDHWKNLASRWAARDQEVLIQGVVPKRFIKVD